MMFDTDVLIWVMRGNTKAARSVNAPRERSISIITYMELLQGARNKREVKTIKGFLADLRFRVRPLTENIGHRASIYMEEYGLSGGMSMADALIAASCVENHETLTTANQRHYKPVKELDLRIFRP